ncbi:hypothetical protein ACVWWO_005640 [Bradyrhizobium sp. F1.13.1]
MLKLRRLRIWRPLRILMAARRDTGAKEPEFKAQRPEGASG